MVQRSLWPHVLLLLLGVAPLHAAGPASLVADLKTVARPGDSGGVGVQEPLLPFGDKLFFAGHEYSTGSELWSSDGTAVGTSLVSDLCQGGCSSYPELLGAARGSVVFFAEPLDTYGGSELWRSDGTREGTFSLGPVRGPCFNSFPWSAEIGGVVVFTTQGPESTCDFWRTDGTVAGTRQLMDAPVYDPPLEEPVRAGGKVFFLVEENGGASLWRTDGTIAGTLRLRSFHFDDNQSLYDRPRYVTAIGSRVFFIARGQTGGDEEIWTSDGTPAGTRPVTRFAPQEPFWMTRFLKALDGVLYFVADDATGNVDLWRSDGTEAGTRRVTDFGYARPFWDEFDAEQLAKAGNRLVFVATDGLHGNQVWTSGGTPATTAPLMDCPGGCPRIDLQVRFATVGTRVVFPGSDTARGLELWSTDGTGAGTRLARDLCPGACSSGPSYFAPALGKLFFIAGIPATGFSLWVTDGTTQGTVRLVALGVEPFDGPPFGPGFRPVVLGGRIFFMADRSNDGQLWTSDGTPEGSGLVTLIGNSGPGSSPHGFVGFGDDALFLACDGVDFSVWRSGGTAATTVPLRPASAPCSGSGAIPGPPVVAGGLAFFFKGLPFSSNHQLWRTDGTGTGTFPVSPPELSASAELVEFRGKAAFIAFDSEAERSSLWESDGSVAGTRKLFDFSPNVYGVRGLWAIGPRLYFLANGGDTSGDEELWVSDGTIGGTRELTGSDTDSFYGSQLPEIVRVGGNVFFVARTLFGEALWKTDGTVAGTGPVFPVSSDPNGKDPTDLTEFQGALYFMANSQAGRGLWRSDGTAAGTVLLKPVAPPFDFYGRSPAWLTPVGPHLFFAAADGEHGIELWRTDGTAEGTVLVRDIAPGSASSQPRQLAAAGGRLFFGADDGEHGFELWESDGTEDGTRMVQDIAPGLLSSHPEELTEAGTRLFFRADDGVHGSEPWVLPLAGSGCQPSDVVLCLGGGRFRVEADWRHPNGQTGRGHAISLTADTGYFWFFDSANVEVILKVLDGRGRNGHHWVFYGALSNVEYTLTVTDTLTGAARRYINPPGRLGSVADTFAFGPRGATGSELTYGPEAMEWEPVVEANRTAAATSCTPSATRLCLQDGRFAVEARWRDFQGGTGAGRAVPLSGGDTGYFWFFGADNVEVVVKVLDGRPSNGKFWVFYGALSNVEYTLTVTDTQTGQVRTYTNPRGRLASVADTRAF
ncbi:MAG TPA: ELWxxDGT repeat protein [Thermoanaerobaculia bacterium]